MHAPLTLISSTVAFNWSGGFTNGGVGVNVRNANARLYGNIIAKNGVDLSPPGIDLVVSNGTASGSRNPIMVLSDSPPGTLAEDPELLPLADNGGPTKTHALAFGSPAIDAGMNEGAAVYDQRGAGYARVFGSATDIGAYERQDRDAIFIDGFDS